MIYPRKAWDSRAVYLDDSGGEKRRMESSGTNFPIFTVYV